jgi:hypothetical protein
MVLGAVIRRSEDAEHIVRAIMNCRESNISSYQSKPSVLSLKYVTYPIGYRVAMFSEKKVKEHRKDIGIPSLGATERPALLFLPLISQKNPRTGIRFHLLSHVLLRNEKTHL